MRLSRRSGFPAWGILSLFLGLTAQSTPDGAADMADDLPGREIRRKHLLEDGGEPHEPIYPNQEPEAADQPAPPLGRGWIMGVRRRTGTCWYRQREVCK